MSYLFNYLTSGILAPRRFSSYKKKRFDFLHAHETGWFQEHNVASFSPLGRTQVQLV
jgi:hypothetical protein